MNTRTTARAVGTLFIIATVAGVLSVAFLGLQSDTDSLAGAFANRNQITFGAFLVLAMAITIVMIPAALFPVLKRHNETLALGYLVARTVEAVTLLPAAVGPLLLVELSAQYTAADAADAEHFRTLHTLLVTSENWSLPISTILFCVGALLLNYLLYRSNLVPRLISVWGLLGAALHLVDGSLVMFDVLAPSSIAHVALVIPIALNEMALAIWLILKGFNPSSVTATGVAKTGQAQ